MLNKKGNLSIVLLVFLVLFSTVISIFIFSTNTFSEDLKLQSSEFSNLKKEKAVLEYYLYDSSEKAFLKTYDSFLENGEYSNSKNILKEESHITFLSLDTQLNELFQERFILFFIDEFEKYGFSNESFLSFRDSVLKKEFSVLFDGENISLTFSDFNFKFISSNSEINFRPLISMQFKLADYGLDNFEKLFLVKEFCRDEEDKKSCFDSNLKNYGSSVEKKIDGSGKEYFLVTLTSSKEFFIEGSSKKISFSFVPI